MRAKLLYNVGGAWSPTAHCVHLVKAVWCGSEALRGTEGGGGQPVGRKRGNAWCDGDPWRPLQYVMLDLGLARTDVRAVRLTARGNADLHQSHLQLPSVHGTSQRVRQALHATLEVQYCTVL